MGPHRLKRQILSMTAVLWAAHLGILTTRSAALGSQFNWSRLLANAIVATLGFLCTLAIYLMVRSSRASPARRFLLALALSVPACILLAICNEVVWLAVTDYYQAEFGLRFGDLFTGRASILFEGSVYTAALFLWVFVAWCALYIAAASTDELRERDRKLALAESAANQAKLLSLRLQLSPHFLFNTLNTLSGLIAMKDNARAEDLLIRLSSFLRQSLVGPVAPFVPLAEEIAAQKLYLDIEKHRFGDRLDVTYRIPPECTEALVPSLILQPLVENAIKHGASPSMRSSELTLTAGRNGPNLELVVENSLDPDSAPPANSGFGIGLTNVRQRLQELYGEAAGLQVDASATRWRAAVTLPFKHGNFI